jgi:hypothetical protein
LKGSLIFLANENFDEVFGNSNYFEKFNIYLKQTIGRKGRDE